MRKKERKKKERERERKRGIATDGRPRVRWKRVWWHTEAILETKKEKQLHMYFFSSC